MNGVRIIRVILGAIGALMLLGGFAIALTGGDVSGSLVALWLIVSGAVLLIVALIEVTRYRSEAAEQQRQPPGPGGGENAVPGPPFRPTEEVFIDPTSRQKMRVYADPASGERRYVAEG
jgi:hypothetical protein